MTLDRATVEKMKAGILAATVDPPGVRLDMLLLREDWLRKEEALREWRAVLDRPVPRTEEQECDYNEAWEAALDLMDAALAPQAEEREPYSSEFPDLPLDEEDWPSDMDPNVSPFTGPQG